MTNNSNTMGDFWVFGYGSLIWNPGFNHCETHTVTLYGRHRALCIHSWVHRGTKAKPGLVLGLDKGGCCKGVAFKVAAKNRPAVIAYLRQRELVTDVYLEKWCRIKFADGSADKALTYVADSAHAQYAGPQEMQSQIETIANAQGKSGRNSDYILQTAAHLKTIDIRDAHLEKIAANLS